MTVKERNELEFLKPIFKNMNKYFMVPMWKLGMGKLLNVWPEGTGRILVLKHVGRKSGNEYLTPLNYTPYEGDVLIMAGFGAKADWYQNIMTNPNSVEVWLPEGWWAGHAEDITEAEGRVAMYRQLMIDTGFAAPLFEGLNPHTMTDEEIEEAARHWCLIRISKQEARTGEGGPGEYAWIWPLVSMVLGVMVLMRGGRRRK